MKYRQRITVLEPVRGWRNLRLHELWEYRELLYYLIWRDVKVRFKQTLLGAAWAVFQPALLMVLFSLFFSRLGPTSEQIPYPIFALAGLVPWLLFAQSVTTSANSLVENSNLVSKVFFPRALLPLSAIGAYVIDFTIASALLFILAPAMGVGLTVRIASVPLVAFLAVVASASVGVGLAAVNARYRDVRYVVPFLVQLWLFASPVAYSASLVPDRWRFLYDLNPMVGVIELMRWAVLGTSFPPARVLLLPQFSAIVLLSLSFIYFQRAERTLADVI